MRNGGVGQDVYSKPNSTAYRVKKQGQQWPNEFWTIDYVDWFLEQL